MTSLLIIASGVMASIPYYVTYTDEKKVVIIISVENIPT